VGQDEVLLDKRPVRRRKKRSKKFPKKVKLAPPTKEEKHQELQEEALEAEAVKGAAVDTKPAPVAIEEADPSQPEAVTFFSKYKMDEILIEPSKTVQLGHNKFVTLPAKIARFNHHKFTTEDPEVIDYIRNPNKVYEKFDRFGIEIFEVGRPDHKEHIHRLSDEGIAEYLMELHMHARRMAKAGGFEYEAAV
jgi:hypothetical protein